MTTYIHNAETPYSIQMMPNEVSYMEKLISELPEDGKMVEWGSGGSTLHWLTLLKENQKLISIEHNKDWYEKVTDETQSKNNFRYIFVDVSNNFYNHGYGDITEENPFNVKKYVCPTDEIYDADIFLIDGIVRGACLATTLLNRRKKDSTILIHDYEHRQSSYNWITQFTRVNLVGETLAKIVK